MQHKPDKGLENGSCNREACQRPLANEREHQFMEHPFTAGEKLYYCWDCAHSFDHWDRIDRPGEAKRITRAPKVCVEVG